MEQDEEAGLAARVQGLVLEAKGVQAAPSTGTRQGRGEEGEADPLADSELDVDFVCTAYKIGHSVLEKYVLLRQLGRGNFSYVFLVRRRSDKQLYALKLVIKSRLLEAKRLQQEIDALRKASGHQNVVAFSEEFSDDHNQYIVLEYCPGGELLDYLIDQNNLSERTAAYVMQEVFKGVAHLHSKGIVHRDLKPDNILLADRKDPTKGIKLSDFGVVYLYQEDLLRDGQDHASMQSTCGTPHYMAPEILQGKKYDHACDLWSCGVILYNLLSGMYPFDDEAGTLSMMRDIMAGKYSFNHPGWAGISASAKNLISGLLKAEPLERLSANEALRHPWIKFLGDRSKLV